MTGYRSLVCDDEARRAQVRDHGTLNGIDYIEVSAVNLDAQRFLHVFFLRPLPPDGLAGHPELFHIEGGVRIRDIQVLNVTQVGEHLVVEADRPGDFSTYTLDINSATLDPAYARCDFGFKAGCPGRFDCKPRLVCPVEPGVEPLIDYMAKDYASFRQALLDLIPTLAPDWKERHEADLGIALVELLAYVGDQLSYYQDAVANEAYLETARQRVSVRRHARLIDYALHDGASARAFIHVSVNSPGTLPAETQVLTHIDVPLGSRMPPHGPVIPGELRDLALAATDIVFETLEETTLHPDLNKIKIHPWGNRQCCLPRGTTTVDLVGDLTANLQPGDYLLFEEVLGPENGEPADADPSHRQVVRLTKVEGAEDPLPVDPKTGKSPVILTRVTWDSADALTFPLCISSRRLKNGIPIDDVSIARGNLVLADHGCTIRDEKHLGPEASIPPSLRRAHRIRLEEGPLSFRIPMPKDNGPLAPAKALLETDPRQAEPQVAHLKVKTDTTESDDWEPVAPHLLDSDPFDHHFVVETDNDGRALIRFGDDEFGMAPPDEADIEVTYRVGVGTGGNVGAESLAHIVEPHPLPTNWPDIASATTSLPRPVRNPLSAWGGTDPEPIEQVKQLAPAAFHAELLRAVTEADYARAAEKHPEVSKAVATFRWTGSWHTVFIAIDPRGQTDVPLALQQGVRDWVARYTQAGYDLEMDPPTFVPLEIEINVCVAPEHFRAHVEEAVLMALSNQGLPDGGRGFFHPDRFTFGQALYLSQLYAAVEAVEGVDSAVVRRFIRQHESDPEPDRPTTKQNLDRGYLPMDRLEVVRLDNDPNFPENGVLRLNMLGGK
jgi:hypothetical protein